MKTEIIDVSSDRIQKDTIKHIAKTIQDGGTVAFPTETVYGLGANALDTKAIQKIFEAKGRPSDNPLIVHIAEITQVETLAKDIPVMAYRCMERFWPGPLTLVLKKRDAVPQMVTGGLDTIAIRIPNHPLALAILKESKVPVAAPSANLSGKPSPTIAQHVIEDLNGRVDVIIRGGEAKVGLESTVLDMTCDPPMMLRPGGVLPEQLVEVCGQISMSPSLLRELNPGEVAKSPGMKYKHYAPKAQVIVVCGDPKKQVEKICELRERLEKSGKKVGILATTESLQYYTSNCINMGSALHPEEMASNLFQRLRKFDELGIEVILSESIEEKGMGLAVMNRLLKASGYTIENV